MSTTESVLPKKKRKTWGERLRDVRLRAHLNPAQMGRAMGYRGKAASRETIIRRFELGLRKMPLMARHLVAMYDAYGIPLEFHDGD